MAGCSTTLMLLMALVVNITHGIRFSQFCNSNNKCLLSHGGSRLHDGRNAATYLRVQKGPFNFKVCYSYHVTAGIDEAQAICRHFDAGDANSRSSGERIPYTQCSASWNCDKDTVFDEYANEISRSSSCRNCQDRKYHKVLQLDCQPDQKGLENCEIKVLDVGDSNRCYELRANCFKPKCWREDNIVYTSSRYGQRCTSRECFPNAQCFFCSRNNYNAANCWPNQRSISSNVIWEPHFQTLDGRHYDFQGQCAYTLIKTQFTEIIGDYAVCGKQDVTCLKTLTITTGLEQKTTLKLGPGKSFEISLNGQSVTNVKKPYCDGNLCFYDGSTTFDTVDLWEGIKVIWDRKADARFEVDVLNQGLLSGLLGNFNGDPDDDFKKPDGTQVASAIEFAVSWLVPGSCGKHISASRVAPIISMAEKIKAGKHCRVIKSHVFSKCNHTQMKENAYHDCIEDVATCSQSDPSTCLCPSIEELADDCGKAGFVIDDWKSNIPQCMPAKCPKGQVFQPCGDSCENSCERIQASHIPCMKTCVEGCNCPPGQSKDQDGVCVRTEECPK